MNSGLSINQAALSSTVSEKSLATVRTEVQREPDLAKATKIVEDFLKNTNLNEASKKTLENSVSQAKRLSQVGQSVNAKVQLVQSLVVIEKQNANLNINTSELVTNSGSSKSSVEVVRNVIEKVAQEPNVVRALDQVKEAVKTASLAAESSGATRKSNPRHDQIATSRSKCTSEAQLTNALHKLNNRFKRKKLNQAK